MPRPGALLYVKAITVRPPSLHEDPPFLLVQLILDCSTCGESTWMIAGHHLRALVRTLQKVIDTVPEVLTAEGEIEIVERKFDRSFSPENN